MAVGVARQRLQPRWMCFCLTPLYNERRERERALIGVAARSCLQLYHSQSSTFLSRNEVHIMTPQGKGAPALSSGSGGAITLSGYVFMSAKDNTKNFQVTSSPLRLLAKGCAGVVKNKKERERELTGYGCGRFVSGRRDGIGNDPVTSVVMTGRCATRGRSTDRRTSGRTRSIGR